MLYALRRGLRRVRLGLYCPVENPLYRVRLSVNVPLRDGDARMSGDLGEGEYITIRRLAKPDLGF